VIAEVTMPNFSQRMNYRLIALWVALAACILIFRDTAIRMAHVWNNSDTYAYGPLVPLISGYLIYRLRGELAAIAARQSWWLVLPLALAGCVWFAAASIDLQAVEQLALVSMVIGLVALFFGHNIARAALFPLCFLYLAVPLGDGLAPYLTEMTADAVVWTLAIAGVPVFREGTELMLPTGNWSVIEACSGMQFFTATALIALLFAYLNYRSYRRRCLFIAAAMLVAVVANWVRAASIVLIGHLTEMESSLVKDHILYGWILYGVAIFIVMHVGGRWSDSVAPSHPIPVAAYSRLPSLVATLVLGVGVLLPWPSLVAYANRNVAHAAPEFTNIPDPQDPAWVEASSPITDWVPHYSGEPRILRGDYRFNQTPVGWRIAWYPQQQQGEEVVHTANYLVADRDEGWKRSSSRIQQTLTINDGTIAESVLQHRNGKLELLVWQWYWVGGRETATPWIAKLLEIVSRVQGHGSAAASIVLFTPIENTTAISAARDQLAAARAKLAPSFRAAFVATRRYPMRDPR
jgi:exosortase A